MSATSSFFVEARRPCFALAPRTCFSPLDGYVPFPTSVVEPQERQVCGVAYVCVESRAAERQIVCMLCPQEQKQRVLQHSSKLQLFAFRLNATLLEGVASRCMQNCPSSIAFIKHCTHLKLKLSRVSHWKSRRPELLPCSKAAQCFHL